ncbi:MFS transporter [Legionella micdadei]|uniref:Lysosomal dipeptide transporter MFSD1 n=1 Tax=Legionella micdadei TaxID=451 RepID=A0A098GD84_LEGMI|nr:MFS transporter [Legionella micdadei]ARG98389.1 MFS transporter [Legionella micdadei]KTD30408.1 major facilitator superfamily (MFS) transporter [Legionella micdadei]CEG59932.1 putative Transporter, MFS superfamily [Legionella micdadei]SCY54025.1 Major Facilitator Superfamily protein [Legionella micdadei]
MPKLLPWLNWITTTSFALFQFYLQTMAGLMATEWKKDFHLTSTEVGALSSAFFISYVLMQIPVGLAYDRFGPRKILILASCLLSLGIFSLAFSQSYWQAYIARLIMGAGSAFGFVGMLHVTSSWFSARYFALLIGISETLAMLGVAGGEIGMALIITHYSWRATMILAGCCALVVTIIITLVIRNQPSSMQKNKGEHLTLGSALKQTLSNKQVWLAGYYGFAMFAIVNVVVTLWGVPFCMQKFQPLSLESAGGMMSMIFIGIGIGGPLTAWLIERWKQRRMLMGFFNGLTAALFAILLYVPELSLWQLYPILLLMGFFSSCYIQSFAVVKDAVPDTIRATALSTCNMILMMSAPLLQPAVGKLLEMDLTFSQALSIVLVALIINIVISLSLDKKPLEEELSLEEKIFLKN